MAHLIGLTPLFGPVPGGMEIMVILLIALILFGLPVILIGGGLYLYRQSQSDRPASEEVAALRREVERLREDIDRLDDEEAERDDEQRQDEQSSDDRLDNQ